jgi:hypothetical protein
MATTYKVLAQTGSSGATGNGSATLTAATATNLYTVPAATQTVVSTIVVCNQASAAATYRIAVRPAGATLATQHYIVYGVSLSAASTFTYTGGNTLATTDVVTIYSANGTSSFNAFGSEIA